MQLTRTAARLCIGRSDAAFERALALDPNFTSAARGLITNRVERGELVRAHVDAKALVERHPENAPAHFALAYVLRYGGATEESGHECNTALTLDPGNYQFRSCAFTFDQLGNYARAMDFLQLAAGSEWAVSNVMRHHLRKEDVSQARQAIQKEAYRPYAEMMLACMDAPSSANTAKLSREMTARWLADPDPEVRFEVAPDLIFCGQREIAFNLLKSSIVAGHFCAYSGLQNDSVFAPLRGTPEFTQLLATAKQCQSDFYSQRSQAVH